MKKIFNLLLSKDEKQLAQVFHDYGNTLSKERYKLYNITLKQYQNGSNKSNNYYLSNYNLAGKLSKLIKSEQADFLLAHDAKAVALCRKLAKKYKISLIASCHSTELKPFIGVDALFIASESLRSIALEMGQTPRSNYHIPDLLNLKNWRETKANQHEVMVIGTFCPLVKEQNLRVFLDSLEILKKEKIPFKAKICGSGPLLAELTQLSVTNQIEEYVEFVGEQQAKDFFPQIDIYCFTEEEAYYGQPILTANYYGKTVISADNFIANEIIAHDKTGIITSQNNPIALAAAFKKIIKDKNYRLKLAEQATKKLHKKHDQDIVGEQLKTALNEIWIKQKEALRQKKSG